MNFEKLKEKAFEKFVAEENQKEQKEVDELVSYRYGAEKFEWKEICHGKKR